MAILRLPHSIDGLKGHIPVCNLPDLSASQIIATLIQYFTEKERFLASIPVNATAP